MDKYLVLGVFALAIAFAPAASPEPPCECFNIASVISKECYCFYPCNDFGDAKKVPTGYLRVNTDCGEWDAVFSETRYTPEDLVNATKKNNIHLAIGALVIVIVFMVAFGLLLKGRAEFSLAFKR
ncbi:MAG TPA: hypothetical protein VJA40_04300 [archaeon]|nr:hypothetical protein [archaeon]